MSKRRRRQAVEHEAGYGVAVVTGGSGALGAAVGRVLTARGHQVALTYHQGRDAAEVAAMACGPSTISVQADLRDWTSTTRAFEAIQDEVGHISVLVNCAAARSDGLMAAQSPDDWRECIELNLIGVFHACRSVLQPMMRDRYGRIVNVVSPAALVASPGQTAYSASKAGVIGLTRSLAMECGRRGVTVNALSPGFMETAMTSDVPQQVREWIDDRRAIKRDTDPQEVAGLIPLLLDSPYMTGQVISVDGGQTL